MIKNKNATKSLEKKKLFKKSNFSALTLVQFVSLSLCYDASCCVNTNQNKMIFGRGTRLNIELCKYIINIIYTYTYVHEASLKTNVTHILLENKQNQNRR